MEKKTEDLVPKMDDVRDRMFDTRDTKSYFEAIRNMLSNNNVNYMEKKINFIQMAFAAGMAMRDTSQNEDWKRIQKYGRKQLDNIYILGNDPVEYCNNFIQQLPQICMNPEAHINEILQEN